MSTKYVIITAQELRTLTQNWKSGNPDPLSIPSNITPVYISVQIVGNKNT
jgi:hypothetical protein